MGRQTGVVRIQGSVGNLTFARTPNGDEVRLKSGPSPEQMRSDKRFARTRENWAEFARAGKAAKLIRAAMSLFAKQTQDRYMYSRLVRSTMQVVKSDPLNTRGNRVIKQGDFTALLNFEFNVNQSLSSAIDVPFQAAITRADGTLAIDLPALVPGIAINAPEGTTHLKFVAAASALNWDEQDFESDFVEGVTLPYANQTEAAQTLSLNLTPASVHTIALAMGIWFYQEVNGEFYLLNNGAKNAMALVGIDND